jgi:pyruvate,water dikinase
MGINDSQQFGKKQNYGELMLSSFNELIDNDQIKSDIGNKTKHILKLISISIDVPNGFVLLNTALQEYLFFNHIDRQIELLHKIGYQNNVEKFTQQTKQIRKLIVNGEFPKVMVAQISDHLKQYSEPKFAIRSSSNLEDLINTSFAGLYQTKLNLQGVSAILEGIKTCWASLFDEKVIQYCLTKSISLEDMSMSVIIQQMISAEKSGVIFSVNPVTGNDKEMVIEACVGLGEALMSGKITPDRYQYNWFERKITYKSTQQQETAIVPIDRPPFTKTICLSKAQQSIAILEESELEILVKQALKIQVAYGFPVDIEWVKYKDQFFFVQSRPITNINYQSIKSEWTTANFRDGGVSSDVCSAFMWSLYDYTWEIAMPQYLQEIGISPDYQVFSWGEMFFGRPYWNVGEVKNSLKKLPRFIERNFDEDIGIEITYKGNGYVTKSNFQTIFQGIKVLLTIQLNLNQKFKNLQPFLQGQLKRLEEYEKIDFKNINWKHFPEFYKKLIKHDFLNNETTYFQHVFSTSIVTTMFKKVNTNVSFLELTSGLTGVSHLELNYSIWDISRKIIADKEAKQFWLNTSADEIIEHWRNQSKDYLLDEVTKFLQLFAYKSTRELDITVPRFGEDPSFVIQSIQTSLYLDESANPHQLNKRQYHNFLNKSKEFKQALPFHQKFLLMRSLARVRNFYWWREELRDLSIRYYYYIRKFTLCLVPYFKEKGILDDERDIFHLSKDDILQVLSGKMNATDAKIRLEKNKAYYKSFRNFNNPGEIGDKYIRKSTVASNINGATGSNLILHGIPCSPGEVVGKVKIVKNIQDAERLEKGDILVTKFTDPGWTTKFNLITAVATETGGVLSHAAVISREYGIPAVLAIDRLTEKLIEGQQVRIDGNSGIVEILNS